MKSKFSTVLFLICLQVISSIHLKKAAIDPSFCWRDIYDRGEPTETVCPEGASKENGKCYTKCGAGQKCLPDCPEGFTEDSSKYNCMKFSYNREQFSSLSQCESKNGKGKCEQCSSAAYPKCQDGYKAYNCGKLCNPIWNGCEQYGMDQGTGWVCKKRSLPKVEVEAVCPEGTENVFDTCHPQCKEGYEPLGRLCVKQSPKDFVSCGIGAAVIDVVCDVVSGRSIYMHLYGLISSVYYAQENKDDIQGIFDKLKKEIKNVRMLPGIVDGTDEIISEFQTKLENYTKEGTNVNKELVNKMLLDTTEFISQLDEGFMNRFKYFIKCK